MMALNSKWGRSIVTLVVDDCDAVRNMIVQQLQHFGCICQTAEDGESAIKRMKELLPDLVMLDMLMPGKEGCETIIEIRNRWPHVPVIAMSGGGLISAGPCLNLAASLGANKVLQKPYQLEHLEEILVELLGVAQTTHSS